MKIPLLPDRERRHLLQFYLAPRLGYRSRLGISGALIMGGLLLQLIWPTTSLAIRLLFCVPMLAGNLLLLARGYDLRPTKSILGGKWDKTTRDRFRQARKLEDNVKSWDETFVDMTCVSGFVSAVVVVGAVAGVFFLMAARSETAAWAPVFAVDAAVLLLPHWITGTRRAWRPVALRQQIDALETALNTIERYEVPPRQVQPMFEMAGDEDKRIPIAARAFVRFPDGPEDFLGLQLQVSMNDVQGTQYPYLYAVIIARQSFGLRNNHTSATRRQAGALTVESSSEKDVEVLVLRQPTTKTSGYHTDRAAVVRIAAVAWESVSRILAGVAVP